MFRYNLLGKAEILNNMDVKRGIKIFENNTLRKQNLKNESAKNIRMKKHVSEKVFRLYRDQLKSREQKKIRKFKKHMEMSQSSKNTSEKG
jgi:hypothetical protein